MEEFEVWHVLVVVRHRSDVLRLPVVRRCQATAYVARRATAGQAELAEVMISSTAGLILVSRGLALDCSRFEYRDYRLE